MWEEKKGANGDVEKSEGRWGEGKRDDKEMGGMKGGVKGGKRIMSISHAA